MDIRIGNDIRIDATITDYIESDQYCIKRINCVLINTDNSITDDCYEAFPQFCTPTDYTIHNSGMISYNATPISKDACDCGHEQPLFVAHSPKKLTFLIEDAYSEELRGRYLYEPRTRFDKNKSLLLIYFPGKHLHMCGKYKLMVFVVLYDLSWEDPHLHTVVLRLNDAFTLVHDSSKIELIILNCKFSLNNSIIYDIQKGKDGNNAINITILSSNGLIMTGNEINTTLTAHIFDGRDDITSKIPKGYVSWTRVSNVNGTKTSEDIIFDLTHRGVGTSIIVPITDVYRKVQYFCSFDLDSYYK